MDFIFWNEVIIPLAGMAVGLVLALPVVRAVVRRIDHKGARHSSDDVAALQAAVRELERRLEAADQVTQRVAELEERLDFTERMLAQRPGRGELAGGR